MAAFLPAGGSFPLASAQRPCEVCGIASHAVSSGKAQSEIKVMNKKGQSTSREVDAYYSEDARG